MNYKILKSLFISLLLSVSSCASPKPTPTKKNSVTGVSLDVHDLTLYEGDKHNFKATISPSDANNKDVTWSSSDKDVGDFLSSDGEFKAFNSGVSTITVTTVDGGYIDTCSILVKSIPEKVVDHVEATSSNLIYNVNDEFDIDTISFTVHYTDSYYSPIQLENPVFNVNTPDFSYVGEKEVSGSVLVDGEYYDFSFKVTVIDSGGGQSKLKFTINAFNDFHGAIYSDDSRIGLEKLGTFLKEQSKIPNTLSLSQGDDWQGSIYSNYNRGRLINDVYAYSRLSARTIGNHDFDWGVEALKANTAAKYDGYATPVLAANVYDYNFTTKTIGNIQQSEIGVPTVSYTLANGLKVGIVGIIGQDQITSITSSYTEDICFTPHIDVIKSYATTLRQQGCGVVIATCHTGQENVLENKLEDYVDLVLCGHSHQYESYVENGLHYYQFGSYGYQLGQIEMEYDVSTRTSSVTNCTEINKYNIDNYFDEVDPVITNLIETYREECDSEASEVLANNVSGSFDKKYKAVNLMCQAIYEEAASEGHKDILLSYCNDARNYLPSGSWTYADLYQSFPFDNIVYIESVKGSDILYEVTNYNCAYFNPSYGTDNIKIDPNKKYKIAVLDYLLFHTNNKRNYDYFSSFDGTPDGALSLNYRLILRKWLKANGYNKGKSLNSSDYTTNNSQFDTSRLVSL